MKRFKENMRLNKKVIVRTALCAVLVSALGYSFVAKSETKLIPFQGKLTDASGQVISDGAIVVQFKMYDAPVGGQAKWNGEVQMLSVNGGLVNTILGTKASLKNVDFSSPTYLEITIDANGNNEIGPEDPPLLPRQSIVPAVYAVESGNAKKLNGHDWSAVFSNGDPETGTINGAKLADQSVDTKQIANNAVTTTQIKAEAVTMDKIASGAVTSSQLAKNSVTATHVADGEITTAKLAKNAVTTDKIAEKSITTGLMANREIVDAYETEAPIGSIAQSKGTDLNFSVQALAPNHAIVPGTSLKLTTSGRPVMIMLKPYDGKDGHIRFDGGAQVVLYRNSSLNAGFTRLGGPGVVSMSPTAVTFIDIPPAGVQSYEIYCGKFDSRNTVIYQYVKLIAFEL